MSEEFLANMVRASSTIGSMALVFVIFCLTEISRARQPGDYGEVLTRLSLASRYQWAMIMGSIAVINLVTNAGIGIYILQQATFPLTANWILGILNITFFFGFFLILLTTIFLTLYEIVVRPRTNRNLD